MSGERGLSDNCSLRYTARIYEKSGLRRVRANPRIVVDPSRPHRSANSTAAPGQPLAYGASAKHAGGAA